MCLPYSFIPFVIYCCLDNIFTHASLVPANRNRLFAFEILYHKAVSLMLTYIG